MYPVGKSAGFPRAGSGAVSPTLAYEKKSPDLYGIRVFCETRLASLLAAIERTTDNLAKEVGKNRPEGPKN